MTTKCKIMAAGIFAILVGTASAARHGTSSAQYGWTSKNPQTRINERQQDQLGASVQARAEISFNTKQSYQIWATEMKRQGSASDTTTFAVENTEQWLNGDNNPIVEGMLTPRELMWNLYGLEIFGLREDRECSPRIGAAYNRFCDEAGRVIPYYQEDFLEMATSRNKQNRTTLRDITKGIEVIGSEVTMQERRSMENDRRIKDAQEELVLAMEGVLSPEEAEADERGRKQPRQSLKVSQFSEADFAKPGWSYWVFPTTRPSDQRRDAPYITPQLQAVFELYDRLARDNVTGDDRARRCKEQIVAVMLINYACVLRNYGIGVINGQYVIIDDNRVRTQLKNKYSRIILSRVMASLTLFGMGDQAQRLCGLVTHIARQLGNADQIKSIESYNSAVSVHPIWSPIHPE
ncbi:MAG: hypothetical protein LBJ42_02100 [Holosporales bacterium]|jgi:hypothetical protein|nr:hypothetical protein [Holosporales bacterium]